MPPPDHSIDVVYTWVDGSRSDYQDLLARYSGKPRDINPERYRDAHQLLRYSLRSLEQFCPWVRNVVLFTARPQVPDWVLGDHPRLRVIHHDEVMDPSILPTFNCNTIESHLHLLPGVTHRYLYLNDDFLFGAPSDLNDFVSPDGRIKVFGSVCGERFPFRIFDGKRRVISLGLIEHAPILVDRSLLADAIASRPDDITFTRSLRFREPTQVRTDFLYRYHLLARCQDQAVAEPAWRLLRYHHFHKIRNRAASERRAFDRLRRMRPKFYCLNDDQGEHASPMVNAIVREFLQELYPRPSSFERAEFSAP